MKLLLFLIGGRVYTWIELLWRGYTHWTMFILGGACFVVMGLLNEYKIPWHWCLLRQSLVSAATITAFEFCTGCVVNLWLGWNVWDYSGLPFNLCGQICLYFFSCGYRCQRPGLYWMTGSGIFYTYGYIDGFRRCRRGSGRTINLYRRMGIY